MIHVKLGILKAELLAILIITIASLVSLSALFPHGYFATHDGDFHLVRLAYFLKAIAAGYFPVRLIPELAYGYGYPVFSYVYPFPYMLASLFSFFGQSLGQSLKLVIGVASLTSAFSLYAWLRCHFASWPAMIAVLLYIFVPFRFVTLYVTGQLGGLLALVWVPLILWCIYKIIVQKKWLAVLGLAICGAGFILSHLISVIAFTPLFVLYAAALLYQQHKLGSQTLTTLTRLVISGVLAVGLAAFYLIPVSFEQEWIKAGHQVIIRYQDHWPTLKQLWYSSWGFGYSGVGAQDGMSFQVGMAQWAVLLLSLVMITRLFLKRQRIISHQQNLIATLFVALSLVTVGLMLSLSRPIWELIPLLPTLQYSWRFLAVLMVSISYLAAWIVSQRRSTWLAIPLVLLCMMNTRNYQRSFDSQRFNDSYYLQNNGLYHGSTDIAWELAPYQVRQPPIATATSLVKQPVASVSAIPSYKHDFSLTVSQAQTVILNIFYYPSWQVQVDGNLVTTEADADGLLSFMFPSGEHQVSINLMRTPIQKLSDLISCLSLVIWCILALGLCLHHYHRALKLRFLSFGNLKDSHHHDHGR